MTGTVDHAQGRYVPAADPARPVARMLTIDDDQVPAASKVSWGAILAGAVVAIAVGMMLNVLGIAVGTAAIDAVARQTPSASAFTLGAGIWLALSGAIGMLIGGIVAARLAGTWKPSDAVLHGLGVWAVGFLIAILAVGGTLSGATRSAISGAAGAATAVAGAAAGGGALAATNVDAGALAGAIERRLSASADPAAAPREQQTAELADLVRRRVADGEWQAQDRARAEQLIAAIAGIPPQEAAERLTQAEQELTRQLNEAAQAARQAADAAAAATSLASFWAFAAMLLGLGAAAVGARMGARDHRDVALAPRRAA
jgi:hypothetical protein